METIETMGDPKGPSGIPRGPLGDPGGCPLGQFTLVVESGMLERLTKSFESSPCGVAKQFCDQWKMGKDVGYNPLQE